MKVLLFPVLLVSGTLYAQNLSQFGLTNNSGVYASLNNPADGSGANEWLSVNVTGFGSSMESNVLRLDLDYSIVQMMSGLPRRQQMPAYTKPLYATKEIVPKNPAVSFCAEALLPSIRFNPHQDISLFFYARDRVIGNLEELGTDMIPLLMENRIPSVMGQPDLGMKMRMIGYREYALGASTVLWKRRSNYLAGGFTIKRNLARFAYLMELGSFTANPSVGGATVSADFRLASTDMKGLYPGAGAYLSPDARIGKGWSYDLGFIYEHRPNRFQYPYRLYNTKGRNKTFSQRAAVLYDYRIGVSVSNVGNLVFRGNGISDKKYRYEGDVKTITDPNYKPKLEEWTDEAEVLSSSDSILLQLPATLNLFYDYRISERWFVHVFYQQNLRNRKKIENLYTPTSINVLVRRETQFFTVGMPLRIVPQTRSVTAGFLIQTGPFFLGTNNLLLLFSKQVYNVSVYTGVCFRIRYKRDHTIETFRPFR